MKWRRRSKAGKEDGPLDLQLFGESYIFLQELYEKDPTKEDLAYDLDWSMERVERALEVLRKRGG